VPKDDGPSLEGAGLDDLETVVMEEGLAMTLM
jgi:hypothetical protein